MSARVDRFYTHFRNGLLLRNGRFLFFLFLIIVLEIVFELEVGGKKLFLMYSCVSCRRNM